MEAFKWSDALAMYRKDKRNFFITEHKFSRFFNAATFEHGLSKFLHKYFSKHFCFSYVSCYAGFPIAYSDIKIFTPFYISGIQRGCHVTGTVNLIIFRPTRTVPFDVKIMSTVRYPICEAKVANLKVNIDCHSYNGRKPRKGETCTVVLDTVKEDRQTISLNCYMQDEKLF
uniref:Uncharacterized protein n=1 Tax=Panagrolaimus sp. JU765 TaxID=591449 RepID=A0AC34RJL4_9BILA